MKPIFLLFSRVSFSAFSFYFSYFFLFFFLHFWFGFPFPSPVFVSFSFGFLLFIYRNLGIYKIHFKYFSNTSLTFLIYDQHFILCTFFFQWFLFFLIFVLFCFFFGFLCFFLVSFYILFLCEHHFSNTFSEYKFKFF